MDDRFQDLLAQAVNAHGHLCPGQVLGVRMGMLGLSLFGLTAPLGHRDIKKMVVVVEIDRCAADALATSTGVKLGRRSLKFMDYGLMAATFWHLPDGRAYRVAVREDCRAKAAALFPGPLDPHALEIEAYQIMSADDLFTVQEVAVHIPPEDLPGVRTPKSFCQACGEVIRHGRHILVEGRLLCRNCAGAGYFRRLSPVEDLGRWDPVRPRFHDEPLDKETGVGKSDA